jgi:phosphoglycolate phosphatase
MTKTEYSGKSRTLLLWDIDGTLLDTGGSGVEPFKRAAEKYLGGKVQFDRTNMAGKTDYQIVDSLSQNFQLKFPIAFLEYMILREYTSGLRSALEVNPVKILGGIRNALENLMSGPVFDLGILTGNCERGMKVKLQSAGLLNFFPREKVFYATRGLRSREQILKNALSRVRQKVIVIGDPPRDVSAAKALSTPILSIATGPYKYDELFELNPNYSLNEGWSFDELVLKLNSIR